MHKSYSRICENLLFAALLATGIGWTAASVAADRPAALTAAAAFAVTIQSAIRQAGMSVSGATRRHERGDRA
jgi:hypothetical protein